MPLLNTQVVDSQCVWGIWRIVESLDALIDLAPVRSDLDFIQSIHHPQKQVESLSARLLLQELLSNWGIEYKGVQKNEKKYPQFIALPYSLSLSHTQEYAVAIVHQTMNVGIDIEPIRDKILKIAPKFLAKNELAFCENNLEKLTLLWTVKEAIYKWYNQKGLVFNQDMLTEAFVLQDRGIIKAHIFPQHTFGLGFDVEYHRFLHYYIAWVKSPAIQSYS
jgi:4'-phosphopantetheinyl transferase